MNNLIISRVGEVGENCGIVLLVVNSFISLLLRSHIGMWYILPNLWTKRINIARGTTDPEIDSETWTKLGNNMAPLALIANLATR